MFKPCNHILTLDVLLRDSLIKGYIDTWIHGYIQRYMDMDTWIHSRIHGYIQEYIDTYMDEYWIHTT